MYSQAAFGPPFFRQPGCGKMRMLILLMAAVTAACTTQRVYPGPESPPGTSAIVRAARLTAVRQLVRHAHLLQRLLDH